jgi:hypothetical protein
MSDTTKGSGDGDPGIHRGTTAPVPPADAAPSPTPPPPPATDPGDPGIHRG